MATQKVICDTDVIIDYWNSKSKRYFDSRNILDEIIGSENIVISTITRMELIIGANNKTELNKINKNSHNFEVSLINGDIATLAVQLLQDYKLSHGLALPDAFIAATSIITNFPLFTYNLKDYKFIIKLELYQPENG
ncbi:MAG: type II toxin-antitoxin system VapC family toxin [Sphingobacteriaceae bacterium]|nr:MAG: type II toxin-antitoxin system VapC family toxin [Sphingobacteriaceae bacterium]